MKIANVIPIFKGGDTDIIANYRPVSLLTVMSKVFERVFYIRLYDFVIKNEILFKGQFGFQEGLTTYMAMIHMLENIIEENEKGNTTVGLFLDFSKAFDTVNHNILIKKTRMAWNRRGCE